MLLEGALIGPVWAQNSQTLSNRYLSISLGVGGTNDLGKDTKLDIGGR